MHDIDASPETPLLWVLRDELGFTGVKYGCGIGECGSCTVLIDGEAERSCTITADSALGSEILTIEGLPEDHRSSRPGSPSRFPNAAIASRA